METTLAQGLNTAIIAEVKYESGKTEKMLALVPIVEKAEWVPHAKSMKLARLALHIAELPSWITMTINSDELDLGKEYPRSPNPASAAELVKIFTDKTKEALAALEGADDASLDKMWTLRNGDTVYFTMPKKLVLRDMVMNHLVHHRGQLSVYLRLLDIPIPGMYGPSADEN